MIWAVVLLWILFVAEHYRIQQISSALRALAELQQQLAKTIQAPPDIKVTKDTMPKEKPDTWT